MSATGAGGPVRRGGLAARLFVAWALAGVVIFAAGSAFAAETTLTCTEDTFITNAAPDYVCDVYGYTGLGTAYGDLYRTMLKFDLSGVNGTITSAKLRVYYYDGLGSPSGLVEVYRLRRAWTEGQSTWNEFTTGSTWSTAGAMGADDIAPAPLAQVAGPANTWSWFEITLPASEVEKLRNGTYQNEGFLLRGDWEADPSDQTHLYRGRSDTNAPELVLTYDDTPVVSSPASSTWSVAMAALLGIAFVRRARRPVGVRESGPTRR